MKRISLFTLGSIVAISAASAFAASDAKHPRQLSWPFDGYFGMVDKQAAQRGFQVYKDVCASCHSLEHIAFRNLEDIGFSEAETKALAASYSVKDGPDESGEMFERPGRPSDKFPAPFANDNAARAANGGALPPDLSLITKARHDGPNYLYSLLAGFGQTTDYVCTTFSEDGNCTLYRQATDEDRAHFLQEEKKRQALIETAKKVAEEKKNAKETAPPVPSFNKDRQRPDAVYACIPATEEQEKNPPAEIGHCNRLNKGMYYNPYFPGGQIAMAPPLSEGIVSYEDTTEANVDQMARDVVIFLQWAAEPEMERRKAMGLKVLMFLLIMTGFLYAAKQRIWRNIEH